MLNMTALVLGGGRGKRLYPLTKFRAKPAVPLAAKYRLIDIPLSNCINSGLTRVYVLTQFMSVSLHRHIRQTYRFDQFTGGFVELLAAQQTVDSGTEWYQGTADAVRKNIRYLQQRDTDHVLILSGDQLYRMDFRELLVTHEHSGADVTIAAKPVARETARGLGIMKTDDSGRVIAFLEKPQTDEELDMVRMKPMWIDARGFHSDGRDCLASMGIYVFNRRTLIDVLTKTDYQDFGKEVFPASIRSRHVQVHLFDGYWEDIGTIRAFYDANLSLLRASSPFQLASTEAPVYSRARFLPPSLLEDVSVKDSLIADGCRIGAGTVIENSVVGLRCVIGDNVTIRDSILMGVDEDATHTDFETNQLGYRPAIGIGANSVVQGAILDKNCRIGSNVRIVNDGNIQNSDDSDTCVIRDGIPIVVKDTTLPDKWML